jgi:hypothetical protein
VGFEVGDVTNFVKEASELLWGVLEYSVGDDAMISSYCICVKERALSSEIKSSLAVSVNSGTYTVGSQPYSAAHPKFASRVSYRKWTRIDYAFRPS